MLPTKKRIMASIHEMPFVRIVIPLGTGIAIADYFEIPLSYCSLTLGILLSSLLLIYTISRNYRLIQSSNFILVSLFIFGGATSIRFSDSLNSHEEIPIFKNYNFEGVIEDVKRSKNKYTCTFNVKKYFNQESTFTKKFSVKLSISKSSKEVFNGDQLMVNGMLTQVFENKNPHTFNYKNYLRHKHIFHQLSIDSLGIINHKKSNQLLLLPTHFNNYAQTIFKKYLSPENASIAIGMITGSKNDISDDLLDTYSRVGVMHLLAVSGLHVGIVSEALFFLFGQKKKHAKKKIVVVLIIISIWLFVLFTGSSASTVRAGIMFSLLNYARISDKLYNPFNAVAFSAFLLLIYDPHYLFDLGFQLSYLAVTSIIFFYPTIKSFVDTSKSYWLIKFVWNLAVLSISANILILPLTIYYFHQVPMYFPITNIIAVPAAGGIVIGGLAMIGLELVLPIINEYYSTLYELLIESTNWFLKKMEQLPYSVKENIRINITQLFIIFSTLLILMIMIGRNKIAYLKYMMASIFVLIFYTNYQRHLISKETKFTIYDVYNKTAIDYTYGDKTYFYTDDTLSQSFIDYNIKPNRLVSNNSELIEIGDSDNFQNTDLHKNNSLLIFRDKLFFIPQSRDELKAIPKEVDYVILNHTYGLKSLTVAPKTKVILRNDKYLNNWNPNIPENQVIRINTRGAYTKILDDV